MTGAATPLSSMPPDLSQAIVRLVQTQPGIAAGAIHAQVGHARPTINRALARLVADGRLIRQGKGRSVVYAPSPGSAPEASAPVDTQGAIAAPGAMGWSRAAKGLVKALRAPLGTRKPVTYQRQLVETYRPNRSSLLPDSLAASLAQQGRSRDQQPAGTYARQVLEPLLIDLSWSSSRLEGNRKSLLDTRALFERGRSPGDDRDATMLLNHKEAIEFLVDTVPVEGITLPVVRNLHALLMHDLLADATELGAIRNRIVHIQDTVYVPSQVPSLLEQMLTRIVQAARETRNPVEAAFFLWVNIAYLQPFVDGNKRTSRLAANMPLLLANCSPLSFLEVDAGDHALAMLAVHERLDLRLAVELFEWTYRRSIDRYQVLLEAAGAPDPLRARYREALGEAMRQVVFHGLRLPKALTDLKIDRADRAAFERMVRQELAQLQAYNCARYRLPIGRTQAWIDQGRVIR